MSDNTEITIEDFLQKKKLVERGLIDLRKQLKNTTDREKRAQVKTEIKMDEAILEDIISVIEEFKKNPNFAKGFNREQIKGL